MAEIIHVDQFSLSIESSNTEIAILHELDLGIEEGEIIGLIGKSGSGKSMFGLSIADLLHLINAKRTGEIKYAANDTLKNIFELRPRELMEYRRAFVSFVFQDALSALNPAKTCGWQINESIQFASPDLSKLERKALALQTIKAVELADAERVYASYPHELSGGQLQRVMIAMAIVGKPKLIIADEPTSSLDNETELSIINLLQALQKKVGFALLFISHDIMLVKSFCDRIAIMEKGRLIEVRKTPELFDDPRTQAAQDLIVMRKKPLTQSGQLHEELIQVNQVSHFYKKRKSLFSRHVRIPSVSNISFSLYRSEILGLMGRSGSGKSTIAKILTGFEEPSQGTVSIGKENLITLWKQSPRNLRQRIQIIFQNPFSSLNPLQTVESSIGEVIRLHQGLGKFERKKELIRLLETVGLSDAFLNRYPRQLSGGEQQRVSIARALAVKPELLVCDECVSALDTTTKYDLLDLLRHLREKEGLSLLFISHDAEAINYVCDRVIYLKEGQLMNSSL